MRRIVSAAALAAVIALAPTAAMAHADLQDANPADGSTVRVMPEEITLTLSENVREPAFLVVTAPDGSRVNGDDVVVSGATVSTEIVQPAPAGDYTVAYRIVSADAHAVTGSLDFEVLAGPAPAPTDAPADAAPSASPDPAVASAPIEAGESNGVTDALIVLGFTGIAMVGLGFLIRAGMRATDVEDS